MWVCPYSVPEKRPAFVRKRATVDTKHWFGVFAPLTALRDVHPLSDASVAQVGQVMYVRTPFATIVMFFPTLAVVLVCTHGIFCVRVVCIATLFALFFFTHLVFLLLVAGV